MSEMEIIEKAVLKAESNGFEWPNHPLDVSWVPINKQYPLIIFNHDFAKALWGDRFINPEMRDDKGSKVIAMQQTAWRHHLRQMVVAENPIKYLGEHLND